MEIKRTIPCCSVGRGSLHMRRLIVILFDTQTAIDYGTHLLQAVVFAAGFIL